MRSLRGDLRAQRASRTFQVGDPPLLLARLRRRGAPPVDRSGPALRAVRRPLPGHGAPSALLYRLLLRPLARGAPPSPAPSSVSRTPRLLWGIGNLALALLLAASVGRDADALLVVVILLWFALTRLVGPHTWGR